MLAVEVPVTRAALSESAPADDEEAEAVVARLQRLKAFVPLAQERVGRRRWETAAQAPCATERFSRGRRVISRAYHKMYEIHLSCALPLPETSVHLCESPGGFVQCLGDLLRIGTPHELPWSWTAVSLPAGNGAPAPSTELLPVHRGRFLDGDVLGGLDACMAMLPEGGADLVTADGAAAMDHGHLEAEHLPLLVAETRLALHCLRPGGTFVVKFFEGLSHDTLAWMAWVTTRFRRVSVIKPTSSRPTNSERYLVCRERLDAGEAEDAPPGEWRRVSTPRGWREETARTLHRFASEQCSAMERALGLVGVPSE
jgi:23S rRNA U2552 (ribose-2'-O)-methylase RlmE/FtsJ